MKTSVAREGIAVRLWRTYVIDVRSEADAESVEFRSHTPLLDVWRRVGLVLVVAIVSLVAIQLLKRGSEPDWLVSILNTLGLDGASARLEEAMIVSSHSSFNQLVFWAAVQITGYLLLPIILIKGVLKGRMSEFGVRRPDAGRGGIIYLAALAFILPLIVAVSFTGPFQETYPFYDLAAGESLWPRMVVWWVLYFAQFVALEFFFRGFLLHGLKPALGYMAVFVMIVPYVMIHFQKPTLEILAAGPAGFVLGTLALKTRTIWWGAALHISVAMTMDLASLTQKGLLF